MKKQLSLPIAFLLALNSVYLTGCENESYSAISCRPDAAQEGITNCASANEVEPPQNIPLQTEYKYKGGITGRVLSENYWFEAQICFDVNQNGKCDTAFEPVEKIWENGQFSFIPEAFNGIGHSTPLLARSNAGTELPVALYAPTPENATANNVFVTPFTTLVVNETRFNPNTLASTPLARTALSTGTPTIGDNDNLIGSDYLANGNTAAATDATVIANALAQAQHLLPENHYQATAAVVDRIYQTGVFNVTITVADIQSQEPLGDSINAELKTPADVWPLGDADEISVTLDVSGNIAVVGSIYHNRLIVFDLSNADPVRIGLGEFAASPGLRDEIDAVTGATEQVIQRLELTPDAVTAIVAVEKYKASSDDRGVGLYRANLSQPTNVPTKRFGEDTVSTADFFAFPDLNDFALSDDGSKLVLAGENKQLVALNNQTFSLDQSITLQSKVRAVGIDDTGRYAFAALFGARTGLVTLDLTTGTELGFIATGTQYPEKIITFANNSRLAFYLRNGNILSIYDIANPGQPQFISEIEGTEKIKTFTISDDGKLLLLGIVGGIVELHTLDNNARLINSFQTENDNAGTAKPVNDLAFTSNTRALVSIKNALQVLDIEIVLASELSELEKQQWHDTHRKPL